MLLIRTLLILSICLAFFSCQQDVIENTPNPKVCEQAKSFTVSNPSTSSQSLISLSLSATNDIVKVDWSISQNGTKIREISSTSTPFSVSEISLNVDGKFDIKATITSLCGTYTLSGEYYYAKPIESVLVNGGTFTMGRSNGAPDEGPAHLVSITSFYAGKYEVTVSEFNKFIEATSYITDAERAKQSYIYTQAGQIPIAKSGVSWRYDAEGIIYTNLKDNPNPVLYLSHSDATAFCEWMTKTTKKTYRLPTEAEWEYMAKGGRISTGKAYAGSNDPNEVAWYNGNSSMRVHPVGLKKSNELGIYDMSGNVYEMCSDWYGLYPNPPSSGLNKVLRGGCWLDPYFNSGVYNRSYGTPNGSSNITGFRVVIQ